MASNARSWFFDVDGTAMLRPPIVALDGSSASMPG